MMTAEKRKRTVLCILFAIVQIFCVGCGYTNGEEKLLRIHVRADSDIPEAQAVKKDVVQAIGYYLSQELEGAKDYASVYAAVAARTNTLKLLADAVLRRKGFGYTASVTLAEEYFPTRIYDGTVVESGYYDALIVRLGTGGGDNWWCVLYPQLCYKPSRADEAIYKSLIAQLWQ